MQHDTKSSEHKRDLFTIEAAVCLHITLGNFGISLYVSPILASLDGVLADNDNNPTFIFKKCKQTNFVYIYILLFVYIS